MHTKRILLVSLAAIALQLLKLGGCEANAEDTNPDGRAGSSSSFSEFALRERKLFASQLEGQQTNNSKHWQAGGANSTLRQVFMVVRHGDRTPERIPTRDPLRDEAFWRLHALGGLTNLGKARAHLLGRLVRYRYNSFFGASVNKHLRASRSSIFARCIESAQALLSSLLALTVPNSPDNQYLEWDVIGNNPLAHIWQPADITTVPRHMDGMLAYSSCKAQEKDQRDGVENSPTIQSLLADLRPLAVRLNASIGQSLATFDGVLYAVDLAMSESLYYPDRMDKTLRDGKQELIAATDVIFDAIQKPDLSRRLLTGILVNDILGNMRLTQLNDPEKSAKFLHYSSHDLNLATLLGTLGLWSQVNKRPDYASNLLIELHEQPSSGWFTRFFYMQQVPSDWRELHITDCRQADSTGGCSLDELEQLVDKYRLTSWQQWMSECGNDYAELHPYGEDKFFGLSSRRVS